MSTPTPSRLMNSLATTKNELVSHSNELAASSRWDEAQTAIGWAKQIDGMIAALTDGNGGAPYQAPPEPAPQPPTRSREDLPYFYVEGDKLVKVGPSRDGGTYEHRMSHKNFDLVLGQLREMARDTVEFETPKLVSRCNIPNHEPLIVLAVLEKQGLVVKIRRGRWQFADAANFPRKADSVWQQLPRQ